MKPITQIDMFGRKECSQCRKVLPLDEFVRDPRKARGVTSNCKTCRATVSRRYNRRNAKKMAERRRTPEAREYARSWWAENSARVSAQRRQKAQTPEQRALNAERAREYRKRSPQHRVKMNLRSRVNLAIKAGHKSGKTVELLGCPVPEFVRYLERLWEPGMSWDNYGNTVGTWNIDHIIPCAAFDLTDPAQQRACFHYTNCRPMWTSDNCAKRDRIETARKAAA